MELSSFKSFLFCGGIATDCVFPILWYVMSTKRKGDYIVCPWDTPRLLKSISPNFPVLLTGKSVPASSQRDDHSPPPSRDFCLTASVILVLDIWFSKVIFPKLKEKQTAKVRAPVGWRSVLISNVSSFSIRTNLRVIKGQNLNILKMWGQEM